MEENILCHEENKKNKETFVRLRKEKVKRKLLIVIFTMILAVYLSGCGFNLKNQTRFIVNGKEYGLVGIEVMQAEDLGESFVKITLGRIGSQTQASDAEVISEVPGIIIMNPESTSINVSEVTFNPSGTGYVLIYFKTSNHQRPWTLIWPDHEPILIT